MTSLKKTDSPSLSIFQMPIDYQLVVKFRSQSPLSVTVLSNRSFSGLLQCVTIELICTSFLLCMKATIFSFCLFLFFFLCSCLCYLHNLWLLELFLSLIHKELCTLGQGVIEDGHDKDIQHYLRIYY